jgi:hypothetical protein
MFPDVCIELFVVFASVQKTPTAILEALRAAMEAAGFNLNPET